MTTIKAPARVCLFGDHQDYLGLPVIACAIDRYITFKAEPNETEALNFEFVDLKKTRTLSLNEDLNSFEPQDYIKSGLKVLAAKGVKIHTGHDIQVSGNIPINAGLSSSSAFVVGWLTLVLKLTDHLDRFSSAEIGHMAYLAEVEEHGQAGGKMDQYTSAIGGAIYINTRKDMSFEPVKLPFQKLIIASSGVPKTTLAGLRNLNEKAHKAIAQVKSHVPDFDQYAHHSAANYVNYVEDDLKEIFIAAYGNYQNTRFAMACLQDRPEEVRFLGSLMNRHHSILQSLLKITTPEIDRLISAAHEAGALGAKIVGSGGGGCIACIPAEGKEQELISSLKAAGAVEVFEARVSAGAKDLRL
ncbi:mevalonate kinase [Gilvibacter sediminis]|uniref:mevalonate kinase family protein n=1 Tax=Gilvibacter sediminis TaxID=379071 RepID=UPI002350D060|nr:galactokinase family protein [Gilvibacter sediminis]MDC7999199.1 galactokinase family protein [Gilvibacter sediminis]